jgi:cytochrome c oxidase subunit 4
MTDQALADDGKPLPDTKAEDAHTHGGVHDPNLHHSPEEIRKEMRKYWYVFGGLAFWTGVTVWLCFGLKMPVHYAIMIALAVACIKGTLVAGFFMHLFSEKKLIYWVLALTVLFFAVLLWGPSHNWYDSMGHR